jgi:hypothetical protein
LARSLRRLLVSPETKGNLRLIDGDKLGDLVIEHYNHHMRDATLASNAQLRELLSVGLRRNAALSPLTEKAAPKSSSDEIAEGLTLGVKAEQKPQSMALNLLGFRVLTQIFDQFDCAGHEKNWSH